MFNFIKNLINFHKQYYIIPKENTGCNNTAFTKLMLHCNGTDPLLKELDPFATGSAQTNTTRLLLHVDNLSNEEIYGNYFVKRWLRKN